MTGVLICHYMQLMRSLLPLVTSSWLSHVWCVFVEPMEPHDQTQTDPQTRTAVPHGCQVRVPSHLRRPGLTLARFFVVPVSCVL